MEDDAKSNKSVQKYFRTNVKSGSISTCRGMKPVVEPEVASQIASGTNVCGKTAMTTATHRPGSQLEITLQSPKDTVLSDASEDSVHSYVTDTVSIHDQETLNKGIEELVTDSIKCTKCQ